VPAFPFITNTMKKFRSILLAAALISLAVSCGDPQPQPEPATLTVSPTSLSFKADDSSNKLLLVTTTASWNASTSGSWIHLDKTSGISGGSVTVSVDPNEGTDDRTGTISFTGAQKVDVTVTQTGSEIVTLVPVADAFDGNKRASTTYQLLIYSFADSDGDGVGDFKGIISKLDYLDAIGATALWLSPAHPTSSYHAYDVNDYYTVNPLYGTEQDFKDLIDAAHAKGIKIYMDYVLNHSGKNNAWFQQALSDPSSPYRDYYFFSSNPSADYSTFPMLKGTTYKSNEWKQVTSGSPKLSIRKTEEDVTSGNSDWNLWFWQGSAEGKAIRFVDKGDGTLYLVMDISGSCGMLVRKYMSWENGSKFGASGDSKLAEGKTLDLKADGSDISFSGSGRYRIELTNVSTETLYYMGCFSDWMPDLNYGDVSKAEDNACFQDLANSADKWIQMGIDGFRLDAVKHICGGIDSYNNTANQTLLAKWYERCNASFHAAGHTDDIFMVAEAWDGHNVEKNYYKGINSCFEFEYFGTLTRAVGGNAANYVTEVNKYIADHTAVRPDAITSIFMTNHDQSRAAESLGKNAEKEKQAAAMMLTTPGKPFIYQGEELGYWGDKDAKGDVYVRTPIMWDKAGKQCAKKGVENNVDNAMLTASISVEAQEADKESLLYVYRTFSRIRNTYPAMADGTMTVSPLNGGAVASWYMTSSSGQKMLVIHNCGSTDKTLAVSDDISKPVAILGVVKSDHGSLIMPGHSSIVFLL
jgi:glycosidase